MDRESREQANRALREKLMERMEANRDGGTLRERFIRHPSEGPEGAESQSNETGPAQAPLGEHES